MIKNKYKQIIFNVNNNFVNIVTDLLESLNSIAVTIEDSNEGSKLEEAIFNEPGMEIKSLWKYSRIKALFSYEINVVEKINILKQLLDIKIEYTIDVIEDQNWVALTKKQFKPIKVTEDFYIVPSWVNFSKNVKKIILDPGMAFGTGAHYTTYMCLQWIAQNVSHKYSLLDYGCGSGILAIAAKIFGAHHVVGIDIDEQAILASNYNKKNNNVDVDFISSVDFKLEKFDIVIANILLNPILLLTQTFINITKHKLILSGILETQVEEIKLIYNKTFNIEVLKVLDGWVLLVCNVKKINYE